MEYKCISEAINLSRQYMKNLFVDIGGNQGVIQTGAGCPIALKNTDLNIWRYPGRRRHCIIKPVEHVSSYEINDYYFEDSDLNAWDFPLFDDIVIRVKRSFPSATQVRLELECTSKSGGCDDIDVYLADTRVGQNIAQDWTHDQTYSLGKMSNGIHYPTRYQRSLGYFLKELGLESEGQKCINLFNSVASGKYDLYECLFGYGADRADGWLCDYRSFHEVETYSSWPHGAGYYPYKTRLMAPYGEGWLRNVYCNAHTWDRPASAGSFQTGHLYDALQALALMNKYGASAAKVSDIVYRLERYGWDGHGHRRHYVYPDSKTDKIPFEVEPRPQYASYSLGAFAVAALRWWRLTGSCEWKQKAEEAIDTILKIFCWDGYIQTEIGQYLRPPDKGGVYCGYMWVNGYISYSWDSWLFQIADKIADKMPLAIGEGYRDGTTYHGIGATHYEGTMMCVKALLDYANYGQPLMHTVKDTAEKIRWRQATMAWTVEQLGAGSVSYEANALGDCFIKIAGGDPASIVRLDATVPIDTKGNLTNPEVSIAYETICRVVTVASATFGQLIARGYLLDSSNNVLSQSDQITVFSHLEDEDVLEKKWEEIIWTHNGTINGLHKIKLSLWFRARNADMFACGFEMDGSHQWTRGVLNVVMDLS